MLWGDAAHRGAGDVGADERLLKALGGDRGVVDLQDGIAWLQLPRVVRGAAHDHVVDDQAVEHDAHGRARRKGGGARRRRRVCQLLEVGVWKFFDDCCAQRHAALGQDCRVHVFNLYIWHNGLNERIPLRRPRG